MLPAAWHGEQIFAPLRAPQQLQMGESVKRCYDDLYPRRCNMARFSKTQAISFLCTGAMIGATFALLYAPKAGVQTRRNIRKFTKRTVDRLDDLQDDIREQVTCWVDDVTDVVRDGIDRGKKLSSHGYEQVMEVFDNAKKYVEDGKNRLDKIIRSA